MGETPAGVDSEALEAACPTVKVYVLELELPPKIGSP
jgi:hypothetical protein